MKTLILVMSFLFAILSSIAFFGKWVSIEVPIAVIFLTAVIILVVSYYIIDYMTKIQDPVNKVIDDFVKDIKRGNKLSRYKQSSFAPIIDIINNQKHILVENKQQFEKLLDNLYVGVCLLDKEQRILSINSSIAFIFNEENVSGKLFDDLNRFFTIEEIVRESYRSGEKQERVVALLTPDEKTLQVVVVPIKPDGVILTQVLLLIRDISETKLLEKAKTDLVTNASHELKTPLTIIKGFVETIQETDKKDVETLDYFLDIIYKECQRLEILIQDITLLSECDRQNVSLNMTAVHLQTVYNRVLEASQLMLQKQKLTLVIPESTTILLADENRLVQVLLELITNAMTYTEQSGEIRIVETTSEKGVKIAVEDSGIGIAERDLDQIFDRFYRGQNAQTKNEHGTGLGLSIVKNLVRTMNGTVSIKSNLGQGTTVTLRFPFPKQ